MFLRVVSPQEKLHIFTDYIGAFDKFRFSD